MSKTQMPNTENHPKSSHLTLYLGHSVNKLMFTIQSLDPLLKKSWRAIMVRNMVDLQFNGQYKFLSAVLRISLVIVRHDQSLSKIF